MPNLALPGNPRYQPKSLIEYFGYDKLALAYVEVEIAALRTLADAGIVSKEDMTLITPKVMLRLCDITTSEMDTIEREVTKHDVRALVRLIQEAMPEPLRRFVHVPLTSYDVLDTGRIVQFARAHKKVVQPKMRQIISHLHDQATRYSRDVQVGRTHGQHALPITVGFWFATILNRLLFNASEMDRYAQGLAGKISGAVGAYNAQVNLGINGRSGVEFEKEVLKTLGVPAAPISTQILPPEPLAYYLFSCVMCSASLAQFGRDARNLMRTEIGELSEPFEKGQVGSSTMAHKRNPINFENTEGMWLRSKNEFGKVLDTLISEHQRDLVGSCVARDFPIIVVNLVQQLDTLLRKGKGDDPFIARIKVDLDACRRNLSIQGDMILAEPLYLTLQLHGYEGDAHELINHRAMPLVRKEGPSLVQAIEQLSEDDDELRAAWERVSTDEKVFLRDPANYTGMATEKVYEICEAAEDYLARNP